MDLIFKIIGLVAGIGFSLCAIVLFNVAFLFVFEYILYIGLAVIVIIVVCGILKDIFKTIKIKEVNHQIKSFEKVTNFSCSVYNKSSNFKIKLYRVGIKYYIMFYNDIFYQLNEIDSSNIIIDNSQSYNSKEEAIFYINVNNLKHNKKIKKYYKDNLIAMSFGSNCKTDIPRFIEEKLAIISKKNTVQTDNHYIYPPTKPIKCSEKNYYKDTNTKDIYYNDESEKGLKSINVIFFDTETNGLSSNSSVLSISAAKCKVDYQNKKVDIIERYERFYYPVEDYNPEAILVNGLCRSVITEKRKGVRYKRHFKEDQESFKKFIDGIDYFVAHNIEFDRKFLNFYPKKQFCTMKSNTNIMKLRKVYGKHKWPKLEEATRFYNVKADNSRFHDSMYDVEMTIKVFERMLKREKTNKYIHDFLYKENYSYINYDYVY